VTVDILSDTRLPLSSAAAPLLPRSGFVQSAVSLAKPLRIALAGLCDLDDLAGYGLGQRVIPVGKLELDEGGLIGRSRRLDGASSNTAACSKRWMAIGASQRAVRTLIPARASCHSRKWQICWAGLTPACRRGGRATARHSLPRCC